MRTVILAACLGLAAVSEANAQSPLPDAPPQPAKDPPVDEAPPPVEPTNHGATAQSRRSFDPDPWEGANRRLFALHEGLDRIVFRPLAIGYTRVLPKPVRWGLRNVFRNVGEVRVFANDVLQLRPKRAGVTLGRIAINTTAGVGGIFDVATHAGLPHHENDFGMTLARLHIDPGPYMFLPLIGPTSVRDLTGTAVDIAFDPLMWMQGDAVEVAQITGGVTRGLDQRARVDDDLRRFRATSLDSYAAMRSVYLQSRAADIAGGELQLDELPGFPEPDYPEPGAILPTPPITSEAPEEAAPPEAPQPNTPPL